MKSKSHLSGIVSIAVALALSPPNAFAQESTVTTRCTCTGFIDDDGKLQPFPTEAPLVDGTISSGFGIRMHPILHHLAFHAGVDIAAPVGAAIYALADGVVEEAGYRGGYGMVLRLRHACGLETFYGHLSGFAVYPGEHVDQGALLGFVGNTGFSTGPHLHLETRFKGRRVAPNCGCRPVPFHKAPGRRPARVA